MIETILAGVSAFIATNIDDIFLNMLFFAQADTKRKEKLTVIGVYLGIGSLVLLSIFGAYVLHKIPQKYIGFLGLVPIFLGIKEWVTYIQEKKNSEEDAEEIQDISKGVLLSVAAVTISNGADNLGVYMPLFASYTTGQLFTVVIVFVFMTALWCILGKKISDLPVIRHILLKYKHIIVPVVLIVLGIYIILKATL